MQASQRHRTPWPAILMVGMISLWPTLPAQAGSVADRPASFGEASPAGRAVITLLNKWPLAYFNLTAADSPMQLAAKARESLIGGKLVILDATQAHDAALVDQMTAPLMGVRVGKPLVVIVPSPSGRDWLHAADYGGHLRMAGLLRMKLERQLPWRGKRETAAPRAEPLVGKSLYLTFTHAPLSCPFRQKVNKHSGLVSGVTFSGHVDPCAANGAYHATVRLDYFSSDSAGAPAGLPPGKLLRIGQGLEGPGGAGWHLADSQRHDDHVSIKGWGRRVRSTWFGPYAGSYGVTLSPDNDLNVSLIEHVPKNTPRGLDVDVVRSDMKQRGLTASVSLGSSPSGTFGYAGTDTAIATTTLKYKLNEYEVVNRSAGNRLDVQWQNALGADMFHAKSAVVDGAMPVNQRLFSAMSYANFVPGFLVTYHAPPGKTGSSTFTLVSSAEVRAPMSFIGDGEVDTFDQPVSLRFRDTFSVDWGSSHFLSEAPVMLKAYRQERTHCLSLWDAGRQVVTAVCDGSPHQLWRHTRQGQFVSVGTPSLCLDGRRDGVVRAAPCEQTGFQQWRWAGREGDRLYNVATRTSVVSTGAGNSVAPLWRDADCDGGEERGLCAWRAYEP
ncbi:MAG: leukocidin family pore-forming toxin [Paludibacterium sp.]|uniref:ricin-type beta-trefoil lectin domain protein n=1 Tax=Paludibacterium sp. TaxID=1917523 RepID=UPI0025FF9875|nr:ricin-type beta-trefoil lectin domain protein [Paludibacterium sp.]MBV8049508.1 leukocidin family pore-forming toxin [Paludibacterium sp.]